MDTPRFDHTALAGQTVGAYRLERPIGRGGFGAVYRAYRQLAGAEVPQPVALKVLDPALLPPPAFSHEVGNAPPPPEVTAMWRYRDRHPNLVRLFDEPGCGLLTDAFGNMAHCTWFAMELAETSLAAHLAQHGPLPEAQVLALARGIGGALRVIHADGDVHRDVTPHNILLVNGVWKLGDFGIVAPAGPMQPGARRFGHPQYLPPEALDATADTPAHDVWSFGLVLAEALQGRPVLDLRPLDGRDFWGRWRKAVRNPIPLPKASRRLTDALRGSLRVQGRWPLDKVLWAMERPSPLPRWAAAAAVLLLLGAGGGWLYRAEQGRIESQRQAAEAQAQRQADAAAAAARAQREADDRARREREDQERREREEQERQARLAEQRRLDEAAAAAARARQEADDRSRREREEQERLQREARERQARLAEQRRLEELERQRQQPTVTPPPVVPTRTVPLTRTDLSGMRVAVFPVDPAVLSTDRWPVVAIEQTLRGFGAVPVPPGEAADIELSVRFVTRDLGDAPFVPGQPILRVEESTLTVQCRHAGGRPCASFDQRASVSGTERGQMQRLAMEGLVSRWRDAFLRP